MSPEKPPPGRSTPGRARSSAESPPRPLQRPALLALHPRRVVVAQEMQKSVDGQNLELALQGVAERQAVSPGYLRGDDDVAQMEPAVGLPGGEGKAQDVGRLVFLAEPPVETADAIPSDERQADLDLAQPVSPDKPLQEPFMLHCPDLVPALPVEDGDHFPFSCGAWPPPRGIRARMRFRGRSPGGGGSIRES